MHVCDHKCSHMATAASLTALGFPVKVTETIMGTKIVLVDGMPFESARNAATNAGLLRTCTRTARSEA